jgi:hypothetical protein
MFHVGLPHFAPVPNHTFYSGQLACQNRRDLEFLFDRYTEPHFDLSQIK